MMREIFHKAFLLITGALLMGFTLPFAVIGLFCDAIVRLVNKLLDYIDQES